MDIFERWKGHSFSNTLVLKMGILHNDWLDLITVNLYEMILIDIEISRVEVILCHSLVIQSLLFMNKR
jgi:hypothetical protein